MLDVDKYSRTPIYEQIVQEFERMILTGEMAGNDIVPSVRQLSQELSVNPNTLQKAYVELEGRGICFSVPGSGRYITPNAKDIIQGERRQRLGEIKKLCIELKQCGVKMEDCVEAVKSAYEGEVK